MDLPSTVPFVEGHTTYIYITDFSDAVSITRVIETIQGTVVTKQGNSAMIYIISCTLVAIGIMILMTISTAAILVKCYKFQRKEREILFKGMPIQSIIVLLLIKSV